jgi:hypothetical protein
MAANVKPQQQVQPTVNVVSQEIPPSTSAYYMSSGNVVSQTQVAGPFQFTPFMAPHIMHQQPPQQKMSPAFQQTTNYPPSAYIQPTQQYAPPRPKVESPKRNDSSILNSMCNRSQRCGVCKGCTK